MQVQDIVDLVKARSGNVAITRNISTLIRFIHLGVSELYRIFNLSIKSEVVVINPNMNMYSLQNPDVSLLLSVYAMNGRELRQSDVINSFEWEIKLINYKSFILNHLFEGYLYAVYKASPDMFLDTEDKIDLPDAMIDALLAYVSYMVHSTITSPSSSLGRSATTEAAQYYQQFKAACQELDMQGYKIPLNSETLSVLVKGYK